jgi:hypothetical protein
MVRVRPMTRREGVWQPATSEAQEGGSHGVVLSRDPYQGAVCVRSGASASASMGSVCFVRSGLGSMT